MLDDAELKASFYGKDHVPDRDERLDQVETQRGLLETERDKAPSPRQSQGKLSLKKEKTPEEKAASVNDIDVNENALQASSAKKKSDQNEVILQSEKGLPPLLINNSLLSKSREQRKRREKKKKMMAENGLPTFA